MKLYFSPDYIGGGPDKPGAPPRGVQGSTAGYFPASSQGDASHQLDIRDVIAGFVNRQDKDLSNDQARKDFNYMSGILGRPAATKVLDHILIFNQRPDQQKQPFEKRLSSLYDIGSKDKDVDALLKHTASLGYGPLAGAKDSRNLAVMSAYGPTGFTPVAATPMSSAMINRK